MADVVATMGSWVMMMALNAMIIFERGGGVAESTGLFLAGTVPAMLFSPVAGWLCDRYERRMLMIVSRILSASVIVGMILATRVEILYVLLAVLSLCTAVVMPARQSLVPDLVAESDLTQANALLQQLTGIVKIGAPVAAGGLLAFISPQTAMVVDVVTYLLSALVLYRLPIIPRRPRPRQQPASGAVGAVSPLEMLRSVPVLWALLPGLFCLSLVFIAFDLTLAILVRDVLRAGITLKSTLIGCVGLGTVAGTFGLMRRKHQQKPSNDIVMGLLLLTVIPVAAALSVALALPGVASGLMMVACLIGGVGQGLAGVQVQTAVQMGAPAHVLGRVSGVMQSVTMAGQLFGLILTPLVVPAVLTLGGFYWGGSVVMAGVTIFTLLQFRRVALGYETVQKVEGGHG